MAKRVRYDAFISYKHCQPDKEIAEKLHKKLENFRLPKSVAKQVGKTRLSRVFRDEAELAVSDNLSEEIEKALENSKYLIAICSPEYLKSVWCMKEIKTFLEYHDRKHVLLALATGEPEEAFPEVLLYEDVLCDEPGEEAEFIRKPLEPLAADCRGANPKERAEKIDSAVVRLMAAICGVGYDDLQQRHRKAQIGKRRRRVLTAFGILSAVLAISLFFLIKISKQNAIINQKYADSLAATSTSLLKEGRRLDAIYAARLALPDKMKKGYSTQAEAALVNALGIYELPDKMSNDLDIVLPCTANEMTISPNGDYMGVLGLNGIRYVISLTTGYTIFEFREADDHRLVFDGDRGFVFQRSGETIHYMDFETLTEKDLQYAGMYFKADENGLGYYIYDDEGADLLKGTELLCSVNYHMQIPSLSNRFNTNFYYKSNGREALIIFQDYEFSTSYCLELDFETGKKTLKNLAATGLVYNVVCRDDIIVWQDSDVYGSANICKQDLSVGTHVDSAHYSDGFFCILISGNSVLAASDKEICMMDLETMEPTAQIECKDYIYKGVVSPDGAAFFDGTGNMTFVSDNVYHYVEVPIAQRTGSSLLEEYKNGKWYLAEMGDNHVSIYSYRQSEYLKEYDGPADEIFAQDIEEMWDIDMLKELVPERKDSIDEASIYYILKCENANLVLVQFFNGNVFIYDSDTGERVKSLYSVEGVIYCFYYDGKRDYYYICGDNMDVFDGNLNNIYSISDCYMSAKEPGTDNPVVSSWYNGVEKTYLLTPVSYEELIAMADEMLIGYEPDEKVKEKYSLE